MRHMNWQLVLAPLGVAALVFLSWRLGGFTKAALRDEAHAREIFARDYPEKQVTETIVADTGESALLALTDGELGLIGVNGDRYVTRALGAGSLREANTGEAVWTLRLRDFALPHVTVRLPAAADADGWRKRIEALLDR